jgi:hypothetical protein
MDDEAREDEEWLPREDSEAGDDRAPSADSGSGDAQGSGTDTGTDGEEDISETTAPSVGPNTVIERDPPDVRLARHEQSSTDAMGLDKRREVVGGSYGPSFAKQATLYGGALLITVILVFGFILLAGELDKAPENNPDEAPWSSPEAPQEPPAPLQ